jgi:hypothetical protein
MTIFVQKTPPFRQPGHVMGLSMTPGYRFLIFSDLHAARPMSSSAAKWKQKDFAAKGRRAAFGGVLQKAR